MTESDHAWFRNERQIILMEVDRLRSLFFVSIVLLGVMTALCFMVIEKSNSMRHQQALNSLNQVLKQSKEPN